jgi:hypothetical protein
MIQQRPFTETAPVKRGQNPVAALVISRAKKTGIAGHAEEYGDADGLKHFGSRPLGHDERQHAEDEGQKLSGSDLT